MRSPAVTCRRSAPVDAVSTLFDRLCELAAADRVTVLLAVDTRVASGRSSTFELHEVLARAAEVPRLDVWIVPPPSSAAHVEDTMVVDVDLITLGAEDRLDLVAAAVAALATGRSASLHIDDGVLSTGRAAAADARLAAGRDLGRGVMVATDRPGWSEQLAVARDRGLAVSVGCVDAAASFTVGDVDVVVSMLDALVVLRSFASAHPP